MKASLLTEYVKRGLDILRDEKSGHVSLQDLYSTIESEFNVEVGNEERHAIQVILAEFNASDCPDETCGGTLPLGWTKK